MSIETLSIGDLLLVREEEGNDLGIVVGIEGDSVSEERIFDIQWMGFAGKRIRQRYSEYVVKEWFSYKTNPPVRKICD